MSHAVEEAEQEGLAVLELRSPELAARFAPGVGMVGCSLTHRGEELLEQQDGLAAYARTGATFGLPLLAPWANRVPGDAFDVGERRVDLTLCSDLVHRDEHGLPIHGLLAAAPEWRVEVAEADGEAARLRAEIDVEMACFPFPHRLSVDVGLAGAALTVQTEVHPTADVAVPIAFGWHPYLRLPGAPRTMWEVELPVLRRLELGRQSLPTGETEDLTPVDGPLGETTYDDCFDLLESGRPFVLAGAGRRIEVQFDANYPVAQVYAPPGSEFICFEPMTGPVGALASGDRLRWAAPGEEFAASFTLRVTSDDR